MEHYLLRVQAPRRKVRRLKGFISLFLIPSFAWGAAYLRKTSETFQIKSIIVHGVEGTEQADLLRRLDDAIASNPLARFLGARNYFAWPNAVESPFASLASLTIEKNFWAKTVTLTAEKRSEYGTWCALLPEPAADEPEGEQAAPDAVAPAPRTTDACFWFDETGILFEHAPTTQGQLIATITEELGALPALGTPILEGEDLENTKRILAYLKTGGLSITELAMKRNLRELHARTARGARILFSTRENPEPLVFSALATFMERNDLARIEYIDLTVPNKVYVKWR